jgi:hypothetical protein
MAGKKKKAEKEKPLEKLTAKELREIAKTIPDVTGVHGMNKPELIGIIKKARGIVETAGAKDSGRVRQLKTRIRGLKVQQAAAVQAADAKMAAIYRKRIIRLKKRTRRLA